TACFLNSASKREYSSPDKLIKAMACKGVTDGFCLLLLNITDQDKVYGIFSDVKKIINNRLNINNI
ncbi:hypothetical protein BpHYR1_053906, partial [Brachionus plicatilis]